MARDLDEDPEQLSVVCLSLLGYNEVKRAFDRAKTEEDLKPWAKSYYLKLVWETVRALHEEEKQGVDPDR